MKKRGLLCLLTAGMLALSACGGTKEKTESTETTAMVDEVVMTIDGEEIMKSEYMLYLYTTTMSFISLGGEEIWTMEFEGQTGEEFVVDRTLNTLQSVKAAKKYAAENEIALTEEEVASAAKAAEDFVTNIPEDAAPKIGMDKEKMIPCMEESQIFNKVYQALAAEAEVDEAGKTAYFEENKEKLRTDYTMMDVNTVLVKDLDTANTVVEKFKSGTSFDALFAEYEMDEGAKAKEGGGKTSMYKMQLISSFGLETVPAVGQITDPIEEQGAYFVVLVEGETVPSDEEMRTLSDQGFTGIKQEEYATARMGEMIAAQEVSFVEDVYNNLEKFH